MKSEELLNVIGKLNDSMIEEALENPVKTADSKKWFAKVSGGSWLKRTVVAACFCLMISIPVLAIGQGLRLELMKEQHKWSVDTQGRFPMEAFSAEVLKTADALGSEDGMYSMDNVEEAEVFLGINLPENTLLEKMPQKYMEQIGNDGRQVSGNVIMHLINGVESDLVGVWINHAYRYIGKEVWVSYKLVTELNPYENGGGISVEIRDSSGNLEEELEKYVTASGRECSIIYSKYGEVCSGYAYMDIDGILTEVQIHSGTEECIRTRIKEIMDAFK